MSKDMSKPTGHGYDSGFVPRGFEEPTTDERGYESHPAWVLVGAYRSQGTGQHLFDSELKHRNTVTVKVSRAERKRDLNHDYIHGGKQVMEFTFSEAQWASFVSSMNSGSGVPATLEWDASQENPLVPTFPHESRLAHSIKDVEDAAKKAQEDVARAMAAYKEKKTVGNLRHLEAMIDNLPANLRFAADSLSEHTENVVQKAKADVEAFAASHARALGLDPGDIQSPLQLTQGDEPDAD